MKQFAIVLSICLALGLTATAGCSDQESAEAYVSVHPPRISAFAINTRDIADDTLIPQESYVQFATSQTVLLHAVNGDVETDGTTKLDRIRKTSWFTGDPNETVKLLRDQLSVVSVKDTNLIRISLSGPNPHESPQVVNAVADAMVYLVAKRAEQEDKYERNSLRGPRFDELDAEISAKQKALDHIRSQSDLDDRLTEIKKLQSEIDKLLDTASQIKAALIQFRIAIGDSPLRIHAYAEIRTKPSR